MSVLFVHNDLDKNTLKLQHPKGIKGGAYTSVISHNEDRFYLQLPKCMLRNGIVKTDKKIYCDLLFDKYDEEVVSWFENLQNIIQELIYEKKNVWFNGEIEKDDIEDTFINMIKTYRSGKNYLVRCYLPKDISSVVCYNDDEESVELDSIVGEETNLIPLVEIANLRFTSRNFQVDLVLREVMINNDDSDSEGDDEENTDGEEQDENTDGEEENENTDGEEQDENTDGEEQDENTDAKKEEKEEVEKEQEVINESVSIELNIEDISDTNSGITKANIKENETEEVTEKNVEKGEKEEKTEKREKEEKEEKTEKGEKEEKTEKGGKEEKEEKDGLQEVSLDLDTLDNSTTISLKSPQNVYYAIWQNAKQRLKFHRAEALKAFLEAKNIKNTHLINEIDNDSEDEFKMEQ